MTDFDDDEHEGNDNDEAGDDDDDGPETENAPPGPSEASPARSRRLPRAQPSVTAAAAAAPSGPPSPFGGVPLNATAWGIRKRNDVGGTYGPDLPWNPPGATIALREWPLAELSEQTVRQRWGAGTYQVHWLRTSERGGRDHVSYGREVTILPVVTPPAPAASSAPAMPPAAGGLAEALQVLQIIESQADKKIEGMASLARLIAAGNGGGGLSEAGLSAILESNRTATVEAVRAAVAPLVADDDDDASSTAGAVANAAAPFIKGKGTLSTVLNFAQANPELATKIAGVVVPAVVPAVQSVLTSLLAAFAAPPRPPPPPVAAINPALPRARPVAVPAPSPPSPPVDDAPKVVSAFSAPPEAPPPAAAREA